MITITNDTIKELQRMQALLDNAIRFHFQITDGTEDWRFKIRQALRDELQETQRELNWKHWKKDKKMVDWRAVIEEGIDVLHFLLSYANTEESINVAINIEFAVESIEESILIAIDDIFHELYNQARPVVMLARALYIIATALWEADEVPLSSEIVMDLYEEKWNENLRRLEAQMEKEV